MMELVKKRQFWRKTTGDVPPARQKKSVWIGLMSGAVLPLFLIGCSTAKPVSPSPQSPQTSQPNGPSQSSTANQPSGANTSNNTLTSNSVSTGIGSTSTTSTIPNTTPSTTPAVSVSVVSPQLVLYAPVVWAENTVRVSGHLQGGAGPVSVWARLSNGSYLTKVDAQTASNGSFYANLYLPSIKGQVNVEFGASYPGAESAGVWRYFNGLESQGSGLAVMQQTSQAITAMGANFPVLLPTWLPQQLTTKAQGDPYYSTTVAAKSFTYNVQIFQSSQPFPVNSSALNSTSSQELATVNGYEFSSSGKALQQLMYQPNQSLPSAAMQTGTVLLGGNLYGTLYQNKVTPSTGSSWTMYTVMWHEGDWLLVTRGRNLQQNMQEAKQIVQTLNTVYLPPTNGVVWVRNIANGTSSVPNTDVSFVKGTNEYVLTSQTSIYNPLVLASSMKTQS